MLFQEYEMLPKDNSPLEDVNIKQVILYFSDQEAKEFKELVKVGMRKENPSGFQEDNLQDFLLKILRRLYVNTSSDIAAQAQ